MKSEKNRSIDADVLRIVFGRQDFTPQYVLDYIQTPLSNFDYFKSVELKSRYLRKVNSLVDQYVFALNETLNASTSKGGRAVAKVLYNYGVEVARDSRLN